MHIKPEPEIAEIQQPQLNIVQSLHWMDLIVVFIF
jgi:hypothetical protein